MKKPNPPVWAMSTPDGITLHTIVKGKLHQRTLSWKELYGMAKKGKKFTPPGMMKTMTDKLEEVLKQSQESEKRREKTFEDFKKKYGAVRPTVPARAVPVAFPPPPVSVPVVPPPAPHTN